MSDQHEHTPTVLIQKKQGEFTTHWPETVSTPSDVQTRAATVLFEAWQAAGHGMNVSVAQALAVWQATSPNVDVLLLAEDATVSDHALTCFLAAASRAQSQGYVAATALEANGMGAHGVATKTLPEAWVDVLARLHGDAVPMPTDVRTAGMLWCASAGMSQLSDNPRAFHDGSWALLDHVVVQRTVTAAEEVTETHHAAQAMQDVLDGFDVDDLSASPNDRPAWLHLTHGWGGGVARFIADLASADEQHQHWVLSAEGTPDKKTHGERLVLRSKPSGAVLKSWPLMQPIHTLDVTHPEYRAVLEQLCAVLNIKQLVVSSLIGHSLDALALPVSKIVVTHDYFPLWPDLHADFDQLTLDGGADVWAQAVANAGKGAFRAHDPAWWQARRDQYIAHLQRGKVQLVSPTASVQKNWLKLAPALSELPQTLIAHGTRTWAQAMPEWPQRANDEPLRVLVPGRIAGGKGETLLKQLMPEVSVPVEWYLVGAGRTGMTYFGQSNVHVLMDYTHEDWPDIIDQVKPDLALMPSTVSETFSYTLSEMMALHVPVLALNQGAYAERIVPGRTGWLSNNVADMAAFLSKINQQRQHLHDIKHTLAQGAYAPSMEDMAAAYQQLPKPDAAPLSWPSAGALLKQNMLFECLTRKTLKSTCQTLTQANQSLTQEVRERGAWGDVLSKNLKEKSEWASDMQTQLEQVQVDYQARAEELDQSHQKVQELMSVVDERTQWAQQLDAELTGKSDDVLRLMGLLDEANAELGRFKAVYHKVTSTRVWRWSAPVRVLFRKLYNLRHQTVYRMRRVAFLSGRLGYSLKHRGVFGTIRKIGEFRQNQAAPASIAPIIEASPAPSEALALLDGLVLPCPDAPRVSVIVPVYNHLEATAVCLDSLAKCGDETSFEVVLVDDASTQDATPEVLPKVEGLRYQRNAENGGFITSCNNGAASARGEVLVFLNNDTAVQPGWLDALVDTLDEHPDCGLVGSKLVYPDGRLQEAGGVVFSDASGWNYGRLQDPSHPSYNHLREVDYCSGAAIAISKDLFDELGCFDTHYAPAYYEDTDLAMKVRHLAGKKVLYQPASVVVHFEGVSSGTDVTTGVKRYQVVNHKKFLARWEAELQKHPKPCGGERIQTAARHRATKHVLIIDATTPQPDQDSGSLRMVNLMQVLRDEGCSVTFWAANLAWVDGYSDDLQRLGVEVWWHPFINDPPSWLVEHGSRFDDVIVCRHYVLGPLLPLIRQHAPQAKLIFDTIDLHYLREQREAELKQDDGLHKQAEETRKQEQGLMKQADVTLVVSPVEQKLLAEALPDVAVDVLSNVHRIAGSRNHFDERKDIVFVGGYQHPPNVDAATWLVHEIWPLVREAHPDMTLHLVGSKATDEVRALGKHEGVVFHGYVEDIDPFMDGCRVGLAPLRYGAGVKGKVNLSMAHGQPVVATSAAVEGMDLEAGEQVLVADDAEAFADAIIQVYDDEAMWLRLSHGGLHNVQSQFSFDAAKVAVRRILGLPNSS